MKLHAGQPKGTESKLNAKEDLKSLPLPEVEKKLGSSPDGLSEAEAQKRLTQYGRNVKGVSSCICAELTSWAMQPGQGLLRDACQDLKDRPVSTFEHF